VVIELFDVVGHKVRTLVDAIQQEGKYSIDIPGNGLGDGVYYCRMITGELNQVIRLIKMN